MLTFFIACLIAYAVLVPIAVWFAARQGDRITVGNIIWMVILAFLPIANLLVTIGSLFWIYHCVENITVIKGADRE